MDRTENDAGSGFRSAIEGDAGAGGTERFDLGQHLRFRNSRVPGQKVELVNLGLNDSSNMRGHDLPRWQWGAAWNQTREAWGGSHLTLDLRLR